MATVMSAESVLLRVIFGEKIKTLTFKLLDRVVDVISQSCSKLGLDPNDNYKIVYMVCTHKD